jgi:predicted nucleic acid-binding protein
VSLVVDASTIVSALIDSGPGGRWAEDLLVRDSLAAPHLMPVEVAGILRRSVTTGQISPDVAALAHRDLLDLPVELFPYDQCGPRVWELRHSVTTYDGWYVALAELLDAPLVTLDLRLARSTGPRCRFEVGPPTETP